MKKIPVWIFMSLACFAAGVCVAVWWTFSLPVEEVRKPIENCSPSKFPGKSVAISDLDARHRSVFDKESFGTQSDDKFYSAFQEERFEKDTFQNGKAYPEIAMADEIYRFFWLRTFHNPVIIRAYSLGDEKFIIVKQTDGHGKYETEKLILNRTRKLNDEEWCEFINLLDRADFWNMKKIEVGTLAQDGAFWNIEGVRDQRYYIAGEQSPIEGEFREACIYLMKISGLEIDKNGSEFY